MSSGPPPLAARDGVLFLGHKAPFALSRDGLLTARRNAGGVVSVMGTTGGSWLAVALSDAERQFAGRPLAAGSATCQFVAVDPADHHDFYHRASSAGLWLVNHGLLGDLPAPAAIRRAWPGFRRVNEALAAAAARLAPPGAVVLVQDALFCGVAGPLRRYRPDLTCAIYLHTPTATPAELDRMPAELRDEYLAGLACFDAIGVCAARWRENLITSLRERGLTAPPVYVEPPGPDVAALRQAAGAPATEREYQNLHRVLAGRVLVSQSGRADLTKGTLANLEAFELLLRATRGLHGEVTLGLFLHSTFRRHPTYRRHEQDIARRVAHLNTRYARPGWTPVLYRSDPNYHRHLALLRRTDVRLDSSLRDGMLLVEHPFVSDRSAAEVLSRHTGAHEQLGHTCVSSDPFDPVDLADRIRQGIDLAGAERSRQAAAIRTLHDRGGPQAFRQAQLDHAVAPRRDGVQSVPAG